jgi:hypothetical protein
MDTCEALHSIARAVYALGGTIAGVGIAAIVLVLKRRS